MKNAKTKFLLFVVLWGCAAHACVTIGVLGEFKRPTAHTTQPFGREIDRGIHLGLSSLAPKKVCVKTVRLDFQNSLANIPDLIHGAATKRNIHLFLGLGTSDQVLAALPALKETRSLLITPTASSDDIARPDLHVLMLFPRNSFIAKELAEAALKGGIKKVGVIYGSNSRYSSNMRKDFEDAFRAAGGSVEFSIPMRLGALSLDDNLDLIKNSTATHLFLPLYELDAAQVINFLGTHKVRKRFIGTDSWGTLSTVVLHMTQGSPFSALLPVVYSPETETARNKVFVSEYGKSFHVEPTDLSAFSYDGVLLYHKLLDKCNEQTLLKNPRKCLDRALPFESLTGPIDSSRFLSLNRKIGIKKLETR